MQKKLYLLTVFSFFIAFAHAQVGIGTTLPDSTAVLDLSSSNKGVLLPRMKSTNRTGILSPANGLIVFDTDSSSLFIYQQAGGWKKIQPVNSLTSLVAGTNNGDVLVWNGNNWVVTPKCNLFTYYFRDKDGDGKGDKYSPVMACSPLPGFVTDSSDCDDNNAAITSSTWYRDADNDNFGNPAISVIACSKPAGYVSNNTDCDDNNGSVTISTWYRDADNDNFGNPSIIITSCSQPVGYVSNNKDCDDNNAVINPNNTDLPDDNFTDTDCDGIDGKASNAIFVAVTGNDLNAGTRAAPVKTITMGITKAIAAGKKLVFVSQGTYNETVVIKNGISIFGGYSAINNWQRSAAFKDTISGQFTQGLYAAVIATSITAPTTIDRFVIIAPNAIGANNSGAAHSSYGIYANLSGGLVIKNNIIKAGNGAAGTAGANGGGGTAGNNGSNGLVGACDNNVTATGGNGGTSVCSRTGGKGGSGGYSNTAPGTNGAGGIGGASGGNGGGSGNPGLGGTNGSAGSAGGNGTGGSGASNNGGIINPGLNVWSGFDGNSGTIGVDGNGGGGGGGGGGQHCNVCINGTGNGGGGGGGGGCGGLNGTGGKAGGGSFGIFVLNASTGIQVVNNSIVLGNGGSGGIGGNGGVGGTGGNGGFGSSVCTGEVGKGGNGGIGGTGGTGGAGGGAAGGVSFGIYHSAADATTVISGNSFVAGSVGAGGSGGTPGGQSGVSGAGGNVGIY